MATTIYLFTFLAIWACDLATCQEDKKHIDPVQFALTEGQTVDRVVPLPYEINLHCELNFIIYIEPIEYEEGSGKDIEPVPPREAGEVKFTIKHPNFEGGEEQLIINVDEKGNAQERKTLCFIHCLNITEQKAFTVVATTDIKSTVDVKMLQKVGNDKCQLPVVEKLSDLTILFICGTIFFFITTTISTSYIVYLKRKEMSSNTSISRSGSTLTHEAAAVRSSEENELLPLGTKEIAVPIEEPVDIPRQPATEIERGEPAISKQAPGSGRNKPRGTKEKQEKYPQAVEGVQNDPETTKGLDAMASKTETWRNCLKSLREKHMILLITCIVSLTCTFIFAILSVLSLI